MSMLDKLMAAYKNVTLDELKEAGYEQKYKDECAYIRENYIPKSGLSHILQGELLQKLDGLRDEAKNNGNKNWNDALFHSCDFIKRILNKQSIYSDDEKFKFDVILSFLQDCGEYAAQYYAGKISGEELDAEKSAYTKDNLYDIIADAIGHLQAENPKPIPRY